MTISNKTLTSTEALNNYFSSLLDEDYIEADDFVEILPKNDTVAPVIKDDVATLSQLEVLENEIENDPLFINESPSEDLESAWAMDPEIQQKTQTTLVEVDKKNESLQRLLSQVSTISNEKKEEKIDEAVEIAEEITVKEPQTVTEVQDIEENIEPEVELEEKIIENIDTSVETEVEPEEETKEPETEWNNIMTSPWFQVLYFDVQGVKFAVPLTELGGIHRLSNELSKIIGRPSWYLGMQINKEDQLDVVDTMAWIMPERVIAKEDWQDYQYVIMLGSSSWGLASVRLEGTERLTPEEVNWRQSAGKRPWLAGMVKGKMCALIHVEALIRMLKSGLDVKDVG